MVNMDTRNTPTLDYGPDYAGEAHTIGKVTRFLADGPVLPNGADRTLTLTHQDAQRISDRLRRLEHAAPVEVIDNRNEWPFPALREHMHRPNVWTLISEDDADQLLGIVPPVYVKGGFCVGEADSHDYATNSPNMCTVLEFGSTFGPAHTRYLARIMPLVDAQRAYDLHWRALSTWAADSWGPGVLND